MNTEFASKLEKSTCISNIQMSLIGALCTNFHTVLH